MSRSKDRSNPSIARVSGPIQRLLEACRGHLEWGDDGSWVTGLSAALDTATPGERAAIFQHLREMGLDFVRRGHVDGWSRLLAGLAEAPPSEDVAAFMESTRSEHSLRVLFTGAADAVTPVRDSIARILATVPDHAIVNVARSAVEHGDAGAAQVVVSHLRSVGRRATEHVVELARTREPEVARLALDAAPHIGADAGRATLLQALKHPVEAVRHDALRRAGYLAEPDYIACASFALADPSDAVASLAVRGLGQRTAEAAARALLASLRHPTFTRRDETVRIDTYVALARTGRPEALHSVDQVMLPIEDMSLVTRIKCRLRPTKGDAWLVTLAEELARLDQPAVWEILERVARRGPCELRPRCTTLVNERATPDV